MINVIAQFSVKSENIPQFLAKCQELIKHTRQEAGCVSYELQKTPNRQTIMFFLNNGKARRI
ncbi:hypothetical protein HMPREF9335_01077 [Aggregatibacter aphrophilus F0387]|nr:hypothetical protein HMPREF9335_01077 [Aggregatibacter aphrophilus F0387]